MEKSEYVNQTEAALLLGVSRPTINRWMKDGLVRAVKIGKGHRIERKCLENLSGWESLAEKQKLLDAYIVEKDRQASLYKKQLAEMKMHYSNNLDIVNLGQMASVIMAKMWKVLSREADIPDDTVEMITMALGGCSSMHMASWMQQSAASVRSAIRQGMRRMESMGLQQDYRGRVKALQVQIERLTYENVMLKLDVNSLIGETAVKVHLTEATPDQYETLMKQIDSSCLPNRVIRAMIKNNVRTVMEMARMTEKELRNIHHIGKKSMDSIKKFLFQHHLVLGMTVILDSDMKTLKIKQVKNRDAT